MGPGRSSPGRTCGRAQRPLPVPWGPLLSELRVCPPPDTVSHTAMLVRPGCTVPVPTRPPRNLLPHPRTRVPSKVSELQAVGHGCPDHGRGPKLGQEKHSQREGSPQDGRSHLGDCDRVDGTERRVWRWEAPRGLGPSILAWFSEGGGDQGDKPEAEWGQCNPGPLPAGGGPDNLLCFPGAWFPRLQMR